MASKKILTATSGLALASALMLFSAGKAHAEQAVDPQIILTITNLTTNTVIGTTGPLDSASPTGNISEANVNIGGLTLDDLSVSYANGSGTNGDSLTISLQGLTNDTGDEIEISAVASGTNFTGAANEFTLSDDGLGSYSPGTQASWSWFADPNNGLGASSLTSTPGDNLHDASYDVTSSNTGSYANNDTVYNGAAGDASLFSMTEGLTYIIPAGGSLGNVGMEIDTTDVPEPGSLLLLGTAMLGICLVRRFSKGTGTGMEMRA